MPSVEAPTSAFSCGAEVKVGISGLCDDLADGPDAAMEHEVFIQVGYCYYHTEGRLFVGATHPLVRVTPAIPLAYVNGGWDFGWVMLRTDGYAELLIVDPHPLATSRRRGRYAARWFVR